MKKSVKVLIIVGTVLVALLAAAIIVWLCKPVKVSMYGETKLVRVGDAVSTLDEMYNNSEKGSFHIMEGDETTLTVDLKTTLHPSYDEDVINELKKANLITYYKDIFNEKSVYKWEVNRSIKPLRDEIRTINENRTPSTNAGIVKTKNGFELQKEVYGDKIATRAVSEIMLETVEKNEMSVDLKDEAVLKEHEVYPKPRILTEDVENAYNRLMNFYNTSVSYTSGKSFNWKVIKKYVKIGKKHVNFDDSIINTFVAELDKYYTSIGSTRNVKTHTGQVISVTGGTYGNVMDSAKEVSYLKKAVRKGLVKEGRIPECSEKSVYGDGVSDLGDTYIEISITEQHLWFYKKGKLLMETDVVTGTRGSHDTPVGIYYMSEKVPGEYLIGDDYKTWVDRWMRLTNSGIGLHDASWRSRFGGTIYTYSGSHGCINLPKSFSYALYDEVPICCPVVIYNQSVSAPTTADDGDDDADSSTESTESNDEEESESTEETGETEETEE